MSAGGGDEATADAVAAALGRLRVGTGLDVHELVEGRELVLAGVRIEHTHGLEGHSDADLVAHAATDALLGGAGLEDIGTYFPPGDPALEGADSMGLLAQVAGRLRERGCELVNVDVVVAMQAPRLAPHRDAMRANLAEAVGIEPVRATVRATTTDRLGFVGRGEGGAAIATALVLHPA